MHITKNPDCEHLWTPWSLIDDVSGYDGWITEVELSDVDLRDNKAVYMRHCKKCDACDSVISDRTPTIPEDEDIGWMIGAYYYDSTSSS